MADTVSQQTTGTVSGGLRTLLRLEGLTLFAGMTLLYAVCLEDASAAQADVAYERLWSAFHDLNELRVSSITELVTHVFSDMPDPDWRAHRVRNILQYVFEKHFEFAFEGLRRKTLELATKQLFKIRDLSPFVRNFALQNALETHVVPVDRLMTNASIWLAYQG